jgi:hypothetical protein
VTRVLRLIDLARAKDRIDTRVAIDDLTFTFSIWYEDVDLDALAERYGEQFERIVFHVAMFQVNAVASLAPDAIDLGRYAKYATRAFKDLWRTVFTKVWAQWRWENQRPDYVPAFAESPVAASPSTPIAVEQGPVELLAFCGGGKDSLVACKLLERAGLPFATLGYSHSIYGAASPQHALLDRLGDVTARVRAERQWIYDDFLDSPVLQLRPELGIKTLTAAETPASIFAALPLCLARGYKHMVLAHEASANSGNLTWDATGEEVNHQWGKSFEAERLLATYVQQELADIDYWSILQPIHDEVIFELLARDGALAPLTHSCNVSKPWCGRCAKCVYVWLQMSAHLPPAIVAQTFRRDGGEVRDLGELPENDRWLRELLGLAEHSPFECVGSPPEARLALGLMRLNAPLGSRLATLAVELEARDPNALDVTALASPFLALGANHGMPARIADKVTPLLREAAQAAAARIARAAR